mmetsp:Transcript_32379/g.77383  ORF Transcript_32379/g.77383 Transcript_32379/m.77383 type:complete len:80 (-) Transcript_32379:14-253(-)
MRSLAMLDCETMKQLASRGRNYVVAHPHMRAGRGCVTLAERLSSMNAAGLKQRGGGDAAKKEATAPGPPPRRHVMCKTD